MSQRDSGYERKKNDCYETPEWVTEALLPHVRKLPAILEPACGSGKMLAVLRKVNPAASGFDIAGDPSVDFLKIERPLDGGIITNPPYVLASEFIDHALALTRVCNGFVTMLLRTDFDHAKTRQRLFGGHSAFAKKLVLTKRIKWFEDSKGQPSFNHAWFIWDWKHSGSPQLAYH